MLGDPAFHGLPPGERVERIDTQLSVVFLAGQRAYKLARPVKLSFCDFSSVEKRRAALQAEFDLNRKGAPALYLACRNLIWDGRLLTVGSRGEAIEPCLIMRRFDQANRFDQLLGVGSLDLSMMERLAEAIQGFNQGQDPDERPGFGGREGMRKVLADNIVEAERYPESLDPKRLDALHEGLKRALSSVAPLLDRRKKAGFVRHCHGDLHLANIVLWQGKPLLFDAIAFNEGLAVIDVFYDFSFLLMDLSVKGRRDLAQSCLNHYMEISRDYRALALLPFFLAMRAHIRAFVAAASARAESADNALADRKAADAYLTAAEEFLSPPAPRLLAIGGLSGSGKTTVARNLAPLLQPAPGAILLRSDVIRKELAGVPPDQTLPPSAYSPESSSEVYRVMRQRAVEVLGAGHSVILDAMHAKPEERDAAEAVAEETSCTFQGLWLDLDAQTMKARVSARQGDASDATAEVVERQLSYDLGKIAWTRVSAAGAIQQVADQAAMRLGITSINPAAPQSA